MATPLYNLPIPVGTAAANVPSDDAAMMGAVETAILGPNLFKPNDQTITSSITLTNDTALVLPVVANAIYQFSLDLIYGALTSIGIKIGWTVPAGTSMLWCADGLASGVVLAQGIILRAHQIATDAVTLGSAAAATTTVHAYPKGLVITGSTAGSFQFQWAQGTSSTTGTVVRAGSLLTMKRIS